MAFTTQDSKVIEIADGVNTTFDYNFLIYAASHLAVYLDGVAQVSGFTVTGVGLADGGTVEFDTAPDADVIVTLNLEVPYTQELVYTTAGKFPASSHEKGLDLITMLCRRLRELWSRTLTFPLGGNSSEDPTLPSQADRKGKYLAFDGTDGNPIATSGTTSVFPISTYAETLVDDANAAAARETLGFPTIAQKGDLIVGLAANTLQLHPNPAVASSDGKVLRSYQTSSTGMLWDVLEDKNPIINGAFRIWQGGSNIVSPADALPIADMWAWSHVGGGAVTISKSAVVPSVAEAGQLIPASMLIDVTTADAAIAAGDRYAAYVMVEGYDWAPFAQYTAGLSLSFWVRSTQAGTYAVSFVNSGADRSCPVAFAISLSNTWEFKNLTIPASPSAGTWDYENGTGIRIYFTLAAGSNYQGTDSTWQSSEELATASIGNFMSADTNLFYLADVRLRKSVVTQPMPFVPFHEELERAQRYFQKSFKYETTPAQNVGLNTGESLFNAPLAGAVANQTASILFPTRFRITPTTSTLFNPAAANAEVRNITDSSDMTGTSITQISDRQMALGFTGTAGTAAGELCGIHWTAEARLT